MGTGRPAFAKRAGLEPLGRGARPSGALFCACLGRVGREQLALQLGGKLAGGRLAFGFCSASSTSHKVVAGASRLPPAPVLGCRRAYPRPRWSVGAAAADVTFPYACELGVIFCLAVWPAIPGAPAPVGASSRPPTGRLLARRSGGGFLGPALGSGTFAAPRLDLGRGLLGLCGRGGGRFRRRSLPGCALRRGPLGPSLGRLGRGLFRLGC
jgi:hypothetical protein